MVVATILQLFTPGEIDEYTQRKNATIQGY